MDSLHTSSSGHRSRRRHKRSSIKQTLIRIWRDWWIEILIVGLLLLAIFLLVEEMNIRETLLAGARSLVQDAKDLVAGAGGALSWLVARARLSDLVAYLLLVAIGLLLAWRTRTRLLESPRLNASQCPLCDGELHRVHRRWYDRVLGLYLPVRRYGCASRACGWTGLRLRPR